MDVAAEISHNFPLRSCPCLLQNINNFLPESRKMMYGRFTDHLQPFPRLLQIINKKTR